MEPNQNPDPQPETPNNLPEPSVPSPNLASSSNPSQPQNQPVVADVAPAAVVSGDFSQPAVPTSPPAQPFFSSDPSPAPTNTSSDQDPGVPNQPSSHPDTGMPIGPSPNRRFKFKTKTLLIAVATIVVLGGASAAAYFGVIVPNQPANVLQSAINNTLQQKQVNFNATAVTNGTLSAKVIMQGGASTVNKTASTTVNVTVSGVNISAEVRYVNQNAYIKLGDLDTLDATLKLLDPSGASQIQSATNQISNKWIEVDSTLLNEAGISCIMNKVLTPGSQASINNVLKLYAKNQFVDIKSTSNDVVAGQASEKFVLSVNDNQAASFLQAYSQSEAKNLDSCDKTSPSGTSDGLKGDGKTNQVTVWVNKSNKTIDQIGWNDSKAGANLSLQVGLNYNSFSTSAPANPEPALEAITNLEQSLNLNSSTSGSQTNLNNLFSGSGFSPQTILSQ